MAAPSYFCPMLLSDPDRTAQYRRAIQEAVADFRRLNDRAPDVLDLGCGTGLLGLLAVEADAATVVSVDLNEACVTMAEQTMKHSGVSNWDVVHAGELGEDQQFDMIVSEMLGTLCFGEQGFDVIMEHTSRLRPEVVGGPYVLPRTATQTVGVYAMPDDASSWLRTSLKEVLRTQVRWIGTNSLNLHPACLGLRSLAPAQAIYAADYVAGSEETWDATFDVPADALLVGEWTATLWGGVRLHNTMEAYRAMPLANAVGRECAWGFVMTAPPPLPHVVVTAKRNDLGDFVVEGRAGDLWTARDVKVAEDSSLAPLLDNEVGRAVERSLEALPADAEVLIETGECGESAPMVRRLGEACERRRLAEPWCQDDVAVSWTMRNPILRTGKPVDEPPAEGTLGLALLPDVLGECVTEAACRHNDERFGPEKPTHVQVLEMVRSLGGDERTPTLPTHVPLEPLEWIDVELPVGGIKEELAEALTVCLSGPLRLLQGYASLTRHGMLGDDYMPGNYVQALPLLVRPCVPPPGKRCKKGAAIRLRMASAVDTAVDTATGIGSAETPLHALDPAQVRSVVAGLCTGGAAVVLV